MEVDFDKEIDALLRKAHRDGPVFVGDFAGSRHLDADEISAFAENATPEKFRALYTTHLADCDRCRNILSNVLVLNAEVAPAASPPSAITIAEREMPWHRRFFLFPNLAYVMGTLVLIFGGFLAFTIIRNSSVNDVATSRAPESTATKGGPNFQEEQTYAANSANMSANAMANTATSGMVQASNANSLAERDAAPGERGPLAGSEVRREETFSSDLSAVAPMTTQPAPPPPAALAAPKDAKLADRDDVAKEKAESRVAGNTVVDQAKTDSMLRQEQYKGNAAQSGPMRNNDNAYGRQLENMDRRREVAKKAARAEEEGGAGRKVVGGRTFERKQGVWYDTAYAGRPTINVGRGTAEFSRLDGGLRTIANSLPGTIVVVWGAKAYRIQ